MKKKSKKEKSKMNAKKTKDHIVTYIYTYRDKMKYNHY